MMKTLTTIESIFLHLFRELSEHQQQDVLRMMEAFVQSSK